MTRPPPRSTLFPYTTLFRSIVHLNRAIICNQRYRKRRKILHVRSKDDRFAPYNWFDRILPTVRHQTFSDEDDGRYRVPISKLTSCIEKHTFWFRVTKRCHFGCQPDIQRQSLQLRSNFSQPFYMAWGNEQAQQRKSLSQLQKSLCKNFLFAAMSAAAEKHGPLRERIQIGQFDSPGIDLLRKTSGIVFDAACVANPVALDAEPAPPIHVLGLLRANKVEKSKYRCHEQAKQAKPVFRSRRQTRVYQRNRDSARMSFRD